MWLESIGHHCGGGLFFVVEQLKTVKTLPPTPPIMWYADINKSGVMQILLRVSDIKFILLVIFEVSCFQFLPGYRKGCH